MKHLRRQLLLVACLAIALGGCVSSGKYEMKEMEAMQLGSELASLKQKYAALSTERDGLTAEVARLNGSVNGLSADRDKLSAENAALNETLRGKTDTLSKNITDLRQKISEMEADNNRLRMEIASLQKAKQEKEEKVQEVSKTYEQLMEKMKSEIAQGQVTISELKGKLTVNMVDKILFDSGKAEVKPEGLVILQKVIDILKGLKDKAIRIEGHTDNVQIVGNLAKKYPTNWELSAARAINVTRFLQQQGIDPANLGAVAFGEYKPVADNGSEEGKARNRRIEITLVARDDAPLVPQAPAQPSAASAPPAPAQ
jgi:chemotaxis protein MotB